MKPLKAGIIGLGVGEAHIAGYNAHPGCEVVALCDLSRDKLETARKKYPEIRTFAADANSVLDDPQIGLISIASFDNFHYEQIIRAIDNNKHVFVEKPLCLFENEARDIKKRLDKKPHIKISSNLILRECPRFQLLKKMIGEKVFGDLFYLEGDYNYGRIQKITEGWRGDIDFYSVVYGGAIHLIDLLMWLADDTVTEVAACGTNIATRGSKFRFNDTVVSMLKFASGMVAKVSANFACMYPHFHKLNIYGTAATFENGRESGLLWESRDSSAQPRPISEPYPGTRKGDLLCNFVDSIITGKEPNVSKEDVFKTMSVCFAIERSAEAGQFVTVDYI